MDAIPQLYLDSPEVLLLVRDEDQDQQTQTQTLNTADPLLAPYNIAPEHKPVASLQCVLEYVKPLCTQKDNLRARLLQWHLSRLIARNDIARALTLCELVPVNNLLDALGYRRMNQSKIITDLIAKYPDAIVDVMHDRGPLPKRVLWLAIAPVLRFLHKAKNAQAARVLKEYVEGKATNVEGQVDPLLVLAEVALSGVVSD